MARVTVEDCIEKVSNRFELVILASERAKNISSGSSPMIDRDNDKDPVIALREIAGDHVVVDKLREAKVASLQKNNKIDNIEEQNLHAEIQDSAEIDAADYSDNSALEETFSHDEHIGEDIDMDFGDDDVTEEDLDK